MTSRSLARALPRLLVWVPGILALILTGCYTVNNHYYGTDAPASGTTARTTVNARDCPCDRDYRNADYPRAYYPAGTPCPDQRSSNPYYGGYYAGYPYYYPWYYHGTRYYGGQPNRGSGTSDVDDNPAYVGGVPATERRPRGSGGGEVPRRNDNDVYAPVDNPVHAGGRETGQHRHDGDTHAPTEGGVVRGGFEGPRGNDNDAHAPTTGPVGAGDVGADPRRDGNDVHAPTGGDPREGEVERPRRAERDVHAPTSGSERPTAARPATIPAESASTRVPAVSEPRRSDNSRSAPVVNQTETSSQPSAPVATEPRRSEPQRSAPVVNQTETSASTRVPVTFESRRRRVERTDVSTEGESNSSASESATAAPATATPQPATAAPATAAPATAAPATSRRGNN